MKYIAIILGLGLFAAGCGSADRDSPEPTADPPDMPGQDAEADREDEPAVVGDANGSDQQEERKGETNEQVPVIGKPVKKYPGYPIGPKKPKDLREGDLEVVGALNHAPTIDEVNFEPNKFVGCKAAVTICVSAVDPDEDRLSFQWEQISGPTVKEGPTPVETDTENRDCMRYRFPKTSASYEFKVTVYDLFADEDGTVITAEDWLYEATGVQVISRAVMEMPVYVSCQQKKEKQQ